MREISALFNLGSLFFLSFTLAIRDEGVWLSLLVVFELIMMVWMCSNLMEQGCGLSCGANCGGFR
jgi:hypothetical protein